MDSFTKFISEYSNYISFSLFLFTIAMIGFNIANFKPIDYINKEKTNFRKITLALSFILAIALDLIYLGKLQKIIPISDEILKQAITGEYSVSITLAAFLSQLFFLIYCITRNTQGEDYREKLLNIVKLEIEERLRESIHNFKYIDPYFKETDEQDKTKIGQKEEKDKDAWSFSLFFSGKKNDLEVIKATHEDLFKYSEDSKHAFFILGKAGIGKTTSLLMLADKLIKNAMNPEKKERVPVIFELNTWTKLDGNSSLNSLQMWFCKELEEKYNIKDRLAVEELVREKKIIPLLDGLDEQQLYLDECIDSINDYIASRGQENIIICSRIVEYIKNTGKQINLDNKAEFEPLSSEQIESYLNQSGKLKEIVKKDKIWQDVLNTPYLLTTFFEAFKLNPELVENYKEKNLVRRIEFIFESYLKKAYQTKDGLYPEEKSRHYLTSLAAQLKKESKNEFDLDDMQPYHWLDGKKYFVYSILYKLIGGLIIGLIVGLIIGLIIGLIGGLIGGLIVGLIVGLITDSEIERFESIQFTVTGILGGLIGGLIVGLILGLIFGLILGLIFGLIFGLIVGLIFGLIAGLQGENLKEKTRAGQGLQNTLKYSFFLSILGVLVLFLPMHFVILSNLVSKQIEWFISLLITFLFTLLMHIDKFLSIFYHFLLRFFLIVSRRIPFKFIDFLNESSKKKILYKIGGKYRFSHDLIREFFIRDQNVEIFQGKPTESQIRQLLRSITTFILITLFVSSFNFHEESIHNKCKVNLRIREAILNKFSKKSLFESYSFHNRDEKIKTDLILKRRYSGYILALPEDTISIQNGSIFVNHSPFNLSNPLPLSIQFAETKLKSNEYFMLTMNPENLEKDFGGIIPEDAFTGKLYYCVYPFYKYEKLK